jgi:CRP-like cAMP-binding protein
MLSRMAEASTDLLKRVPLFADLEDGELKQIARSMKERRFSAGETVTEEGKGGIGFFVIGDGNAKVEVHGDQVRTLGPGDYFGEIGLIADIDRTATITADGDLTCFGMTSWDFKPLVESNASIAWKLLQVMAERLKEAQTR